jgi:two-component system cell cycle sensor histidine kinase PleC
LPILDGAQHSLTALWARAVAAWHEGVAAVVRSVQPTEENAWLADAQIKLYRQGSRYAMLLVPVGAFFVAEACEPWVSREMRYGWWGVLATVCLAFFAIERRMLAKPVETLSDLRHQARVFLALNIAFLLAWCSMGAFLWAPGEPVDNMLIVLVLACSLAGSTAIAAVHPASALCIFLMHAVFILAPPAFSAWPLDHTLAWLSGIFIVLMAGQAVALNASTTKMLTLEHERAGMLDGLLKAKAESDRDRERAASASRAKSQFLSNMNHELRTPMNAILGFSELMKSVPTGPEKNAEYASIIHDSGKNLLALIDGMLDLAKIEGGKLYLRESDLSISHLISEAVMEVEQTAQSKNLSLARNVPRGLPMVHGDERGLRQIVTNLISNAVKFTPPGGCVTAFARLEADGRICFGVEDTGIGIAPEDQTQVFERFGHGRHDVTTADKGTGLGLAIVKGFAEAHDGEVLLESEQGLGTRVTVTLPKERVVPTYARSAVA